MNELVRLVSEHPVAQGVGLVALAVTVLSYQARTTRGIALRQAVGSFFWTAHMLLLGAWTGGLLNLLGLVRGSVYSRRGERAWASRPFWPWLFGALCVGAAAFAGLSQGDAARRAGLVAQHRDAERHEAHRLRDGVLGHEMGHAPVRTSSG